MTRDVVAVIVNYNAGGLLKQAVDALLAGSLRPEIDVVDNASTDGSIDVLRSDPAYKETVSLTANAANRGFAGANNQILRVGDARYYLLLNPDCIVDPDAVSELRAFMDRNPEVGLAGAALRNSDGSLQKTSKRRFPTPLSALARSLGLHRLGVAEGAMGDFDLAGERGDGAEAVDAISGALMFVRGSALGRVGLLDEGYFMHCEVLDWCKRFWDAGYQVAFVPSAGARHVKGGSGRGARVTWHLHRGMIRFYDKHYRDELGPVYYALTTGIIRIGMWLRLAIHALSPGGSEN